MTTSSHSGCRDHRGSRPRTSWLRPGALCASALFAVCSAVGSPGAHADNAPATEAGAWQKHQYSFAFMGFTSTYSCDGLADKLKILLVAAGARPDAAARAGACASGFGRPDKFARADLTFYTLAPVSDATDAKPVQGTWVPVSLAAHQPRDLSTGDCELVEQFRSNVLAMFTTRNVENRTSCVPHQLSGSTIDLKFEAFAPPPKPPRAHAAGAAPT